ncbi:SSI family serine proteinase inhibitor [Planobispora rosea]|nr:SSI family serine proteinase inhibitor [Planobispora rosea]
MRRLLVLAATAPLLLSGTASAATPSSPHSAAATEKSFMLAVADDNQDLLAGRYAVLRCDPPGGTHRKATKACEALEAAGGNPADVARDRRRTCTTEYKPVKAFAVGTWNGEDIIFEHTYGNFCAMLAATGPVFDF